MPLVQAGNEFAGVASAEQSEDIGGVGDDFAVGCEVVAALERVPVKF